MEIVHQRQNILYDMESSPKGNDNFATKVISTENVEKKCKRCKKEESNLFLFQVINLGDDLKLPPRGNDHHHRKQFSSLFYMLFRMYNMDKTYDAHLNAKLCT